jgi:hypothetical protein
MPVSVAPVQGLRYVAMFNVALGYCSKKIQKAVVNEAINGECKVFAF